jgi:hypothetical protein
MMINEKQMHHEIASIASPSFVPQQGSAIQV